MAGGTCPHETQSHRPGHGEESRPRLSRGWRGPRRHRAGGLAAPGGMGAATQASRPTGTGQLWGHHAQGPKHGLLKGLQGPGLFAAPSPSATCQLEMGSQGDSR